MARKTFRVPQQFRVGGKASPQPVPIRATDIPPEGYVLRPPQFIPIPPRPEGYSGVMLDGTDDPQVLANFLQEIVDGLRSGDVQFEGVEREVLYRMGTDTDGTPLVNLDTGDRKLRLALAYRRFTSVHPNTVGLTTSGIPDELLRAGAEEEARNVPA